MEGVALERDFVEGAAGAAVDVEGVGGGEAVRNPGVEKDGEGGGSAIEEVAGGVDLEAKGT